MDPVLSINEIFARSITSSTKTTRVFNKDIPNDPWMFASDIQALQDINILHNGYHHVLYNKGRYFETTISDRKVLNEVSELIKSPVQHDNMIVDSWTKLEDFVIAMNCLGIYVSIKTDWI
jgi:hypothetical protein